MNVRQARAIVACSQKIKAAVESCLVQIEGPLRNEAEAYWAAHLKSIADGTVYGGMPIHRAMQVLEGRE
jgi:hypothetical protein